MPKNKTYVSLSSTVFCLGYLTSSGVTKSFKFSSLESVAIAVYSHLRYNSFSGFVSDFKVTSTKGKALNVSELFVYGYKLTVAQSHHDSGYVWRQGSVPGIHRRRGGHCYRHIRAIGARRQAALVVVEDGEVAPRGARSVTSLPNAWDEYGIHIDQCWKSQRKGRKSWDR